MNIDCDIDRYINEVLGSSEYRGVFEDLVVIDVGCNIGAFAFWIYPLVKSLYCLDISEVNINHLNKTCEEGGLNKIKTYFAGISGTGGRRKYKTSTDAGMGGWSLSEEGTFEVGTYSLREFIDMEKIDYVDILKLDIEGGEYEVLNKDFPTDKITTIVGEYHGEPPKEQFDLLGYRYFELPGKRFVARRK